MTKVFYSICSKGGLNGDNSVWGVGEGGVRTGHPIPPIHPPSDENGRKNLICTSVSTFLNENGIGFGKYGLEMELEYASVRKQTHMVRNSTETVGSRELKPEYRTSLYSQIIITHENSSQMIRI
jgi:hypothetical protein